VDGGKEEILAALDGSFERDRQRGYTGKGPHADDLEVTVSERPARRFGSQGQQRIAVLAMKIAETMALQEVTGRVPVLLLDDISSELDRERNRELFGFLRQVGGQVFITTTHLDHVLLEEDRKDFEIQEGVLK
jgi:DNA replication and repair protein RecF